MLVVHSQFKITLSSVMVQAFLSQSTCLLTNNSNCKFTFLFFLCLTYILAQTYEKKHKLHHNHAFNPKSIHNTNFHKKIKVFHCIIIKVKLNYSICFKTNIPTIHKKYKYIIINKNQNYSKLEQGQSREVSIVNGKDHFFLQHSLNTYPNSSAMRLRQPSILSK